MTGEPAYVVPDLVEPIIGYRSWTVRINPAGEPVLCSPYRRHVWTPREALSALRGRVAWADGVAVDADPAWVARASPY